LFELFFTDSWFGWYGIQWWIPIGANNVLGGQFLSSKVDFEVEVSLESTNIFLKPVLGRLGSGAEVKAEA
jgi:hypothetical protein